MNGVRFYLEYASKSDKRAGKHSGTVFAAFVGNGYHAYVSQGVAQYDGVGATEKFPNCPVAGTSASLEYLRTQCKRISEQEAREIHPQLFVYLDKEQ